MHNYLTISLHEGGVAAKWFDNVERIQVRIGGGASIVDWLITPDEAAALRDQLDAAIEAAKAGA